MRPARVISCTGWARAPSSTQKPWAPRGAEGVDFCAFDATGRFLVGYGMDDAGLYRGLPYIGALD